MPPVPARRPAARRRLAALGVVGGILGAAAGPAAARPQRGPGAELGGSVGLGRWTDTLPATAAPGGGVSTATETTLHLHADAVLPAGWWFSGDLSRGALSFGRPAEPENGDLLDDLDDHTAWSNAAALRAGWAARRWGLALGPGWQRRAFDAPQWRPSIELWGGRPDWLYAFLDANAGPVSGGAGANGAIGLGHQGRIGSLSAGSSLVGYRVAGDLSLGLAARLGLRVDWARPAGAAAADLRALLTLTIDHRRLRPPPPAEGARPSP